MFLDEAQRLIKKGFMVDELKIREQYFLEELNARKVHSMTEAKLNINIKYKA